MWSSKSFLKTHFDWQTLPYSYDDISDLEPLLEENYTQVHDVKPFINTINCLLQNKQLLILKRYCKWLDYFNQRIFEKTSLYYGIVNALNNAALENELFRTQTGHEFETSLYFFDFLYAQQLEIHTFENKDALSLLNIALLYGKYPGLQQKSLKKAFILFKGGINSASISSFFQQFFLRYENPILLTAYITYLKTNEEFDLLVWLLQGKNVRKFNSKTACLSKKEAYYFINFPEKILDYTDYILERAIISSKLINEKCVNRNIPYNILKASKMFVNKPLKVFQDCFFWKTTVEFYVKAESSSEGELYSYQDFIDFVEYKRYEEDSEFNFKGRTPNSIINLIWNWHRFGSLTEQENIKIVQWKHSLLPELIIEKEGVNYLIKELTSGLELFEEAKILNHCVFSYTNYCGMGYMRIYSLRIIDSKKQTPILTLEVKNNQITQISGNYNREASVEEMGIIKEWAKKNELEISHEN